MATDAGYWVPMPFSRDGVAEEHFLKRYNECSEEEKRAVDEIMQTRSSTAAGAIGDTVETEGRELRDPTKPLPTDRGAAAMQQGDKQALEEAMDAYRSRPDIKDTDFAKITRQAAQGRRNAG
eukprot:jgi/Chrzof1/4212/Cz14g03090.t1